MTIDRRKLGSRLAPKLELESDNSVNMDVARKIKTKVSAEFKMRGLILRPYVFKIYGSCVS